MSEIKLSIKLKSLFSQSLFWLALIILLAAVLRLWGTGYGLPGYIYHTDEPLYVSGILKWLDGDLNALAARSDFPSVFFVLLYLIFGATRVLADWFHPCTPALSDYIFVGRVVSAFFSIATVWLVYLLTRRLFNRTVGLFAALALAVTFLDVQIAHYAKQDPYVGFFGVAALLFTWLLWEKKHWWYFWLSLGAIILTGTVKLYGFLFLLPLLLIIFAEWDRARKVKNRPAQWRSIVWLIIVIVVLSVLLRIYTQQSPVDITGVVETETDFVSRLVNRLLDPFKGVDMTLASDADGVPNFFWWLRYLVQVGVYYPLFLGALGGLILVLRRISFKVVWLLIFPSIYTVILCLQKVRFDRWASVLTPFLAVGAGFFAYWCLQRMRETGLAIKRGLTIGLVSLLFALPGMRVVLFDYTISQPETREEAEKYIGSLVQPGQIIFAYGASATAQLLMRDYPGLNIHEIDAWPDGQRDIFRFAGEKILLDKSQYDIAYNYRQTNRYRSTYKTMDLLFSRSKIDWASSYVLFDVDFFSPTDLEHGSTVNNYHQPAMYLLTIPDEPDLDLPPLEKIYSAESMAAASSAQLVETDGQQCLALSSEVSDGVVGGREPLPAGTYRVEFILALENSFKSDDIARVGIRDFGRNIPIISEAVLRDPKNSTGQPFSVSLPLKLDRATLIEFTVNDLDLPGTKIRVDRIKVNEALIDEEDFERRRVEGSTSQGSTFSARQIANFTNLTAEYEPQTSTGFVIKNKSTGGPYLELGAGNYRAVFTLSYDIPATLSCANFDVVTGGGGQTLTSQDVVGTSEGHYQEQILDFYLASPGQIEARLNYLGCGQVWLDKLEIKPR